MLGYNRRVLRNCYYEHRPHTSWRIWLRSKASDGILSFRVVMPCH